MSTLAAHRIPDWRLHLALITDFLSPGPDHPGADSDWLQKLREAGPASRAAVRHPDDTPTAIIPAIRRPATALTNVPYQLVDVPHLGELPIGPLEPAHIHNQLIGAGR